MSSDPTHPRREWRFRLLLVATSLALSLGVAEVALRVVGLGAPPSGDPAGLTFFSHDEQLGWDLVAGANDRLQTPEFDIEIRITEQGLRSHRTFAAKPPDGRRRLLVLGDSFTFGHGVQVEEAWPARLEARRDDLEVVNLAVTGYGTDQQLLRFEQRHANLAPDAVVLGLFVGNVFRNARFEQLGYNKPRFVRRGGELELAGVPVPTERPRAPGSRLLGLLTGVTSSLFEHLGYGEAWAVSDAILARLDQRCRSLGIPLFVLILPKDQSIHGSGPRRALHDRTLARVRRLLADRGLPFLDLTDALRQSAAQGAGQLYFPQDGHWNATGHEVATVAIDDWLAESFPAARADAP